MSADVKTKYTLMGITHFQVLIESKLIPVTVENFERAKKQQEKFYGVCYISSDGETMTLLPSDKILQTWSDGNW